MVVCKFFLQGTCKFGSSCKFEHDINGSANTQSVSIMRQNAPPNTGNVVDVTALVRSVQSDMMNTEKGGQWLLSSYAPFKEKPAFPGFEDKSFEEVRLGFYEATKNGTVEQYKQQLQGLLQEAIMKMRTLQNPSQEIVNLLKQIYNTPLNPQQANANVFANQNTFANQTPAANPNPFGGSLFSQTNQQPSSPFSGNSAFNTQATANSVFNTQTTTNSVFGKQATSPFNAQTGNSPFNSQSSFSNQNSNSPFSSQLGNTSPFTAVQQQGGFNQAAASPFAQNTSPFTQVQNSGSFQQSPFSAPQNVSPFAQNQATPQTQAVSPFAQVQKPFTQTQSVPTSQNVSPFIQAQNSSPFTTTSPFTQSAQVNASVFTSQAQVTSPFAAQTPLQNPSPFTPQAQTQNAFNAQNPSPFASQAQAQNASPFNAQAQAQNASPFNAQVPMQNVSPFAQVQAQNTTKPSQFAQPQGQSTFAPGSPFSSQSIFGSNQSTVTSVFGGQAPNIATVDAALYSKETELTKEDMDAFRSESFVMGSIPSNPPPAELCF